MNARGRLAGDRMAHARRRRGLSQLELADMIGRSESWVSKVETGLIRLKDIELAERIAELLAVDLTHLLGLDAPASTPAPAGRAGHTRDRQAPLLINAHEWENWDAMKRRWFLTQGAGAALAVVEALRATAAETADRLTAALTGGSVDAKTVAGVEQVVLGWRQAYRSASAASLLGPAHGTLDLLVELAPDAGPRQARMVSLIGQMSSLLGTMLMLDLGDFPAARHYLTVSVRAGQQACDNELTAFALGCRAFHSAYDTTSPDLGAGVEFAEASLDTARRGCHPRTHAWLAAVTSEMRAATGQDSGCQHALDDAAALLERPQPERDWLGIGAFDHAKLTAYRGGDLSRLGKHTQAQAILLEALAALEPGMRKHRCTAHIDLAESYARSGELDASCEHAVSALGIVKSTRHADSLKRIDTLHTTLKTTRTPAVRRLGDQLIECKAAS